MVAVGRPDSEDWTMHAVTTIGLDIAKSVFQVHGVDAEGNVVVRRKLKRRHIIPFFQKLRPCLVGIEACASSHHWARELHARIATPGRSPRWRADAGQSRSALARWGRNRACRPCRARHSGLLLLF